MEQEGAEGTERRDESSALPAVSCRVGLESSFGADASASCAGSLQSLDRHLSRDLAPDEGMA